MSSSVPLLFLDRFSAFQFSHFPVFPLSRVPAFPFSHFPVFPFPNYFTSPLSRIPFFPFSCFPDYGCVRLKPGFLFCRVVICFQFCGLSAIGAASVPTPLVPVAKLPVDSSRHKFERNLSFSILYPPVTVVPLAFVFPVFCGGLQGGQSALRKRGPTMKEHDIEGKRQAFTSAWKTRPHKAENTISRKHLILHVHSNASMGISHTHSNETWLPAEKSRANMAATWHRTSEKSGRWEIGKTGQRESGKTGN